jgi:hypothetical protein
MSLDGVAGKMVIAELDASGRSGLVGTLTWQIVELPSGDIIKAATVDGISLVAGTTDKYAVAFTRPSLPGEYALRWEFSDLVADEAFLVTPAGEDVPTDYMPSVSDVGALLRARTKDQYGNELGTFTDETRPTETEVINLIDVAAREVTSTTDTDIPPLANEDVAKLIAMRAAMLIELSYYPEQINSGRSPYPQFKELYDEQLPIVMRAVEREASDLALGEQTSEAGKMAQYTFSDASDQPCRAPGAEPLRRGQSTRMIGLRSIL